MIPANKLGSSVAESDGVGKDRKEYKVKGIDDYNLGDYVEDYPSGTYNLSIREMMDGIPIYVDVGDRLSLDLASDKGKKG